MSAGRTGCRFRRFRRQPSLFVMDQVQPEKSQLLQQLQELDIDSMTPRDALDCLYELKKLSEKIES